MGVSDHHLQVSFKKKKKTPENTMQSNKTTAKNVYQKKEDKKYEGIFRLQT